MGIDGARKLVLALLLACFTGSFGGPAAGVQNLVTNDTFVVTGGSTSFRFGTYGPYTPPETLAGWASPGGYNYLFLPNSTTATGFYGDLSPRSPTTGSANGFTNASPTGGNVVAGNSDFGTMPITQTTNDLIPRERYHFSFAWAGAQQSGFTGDTTDQWHVTLGSQTFSTSMINLPSEGFSGWMNQAFNFTPTTTSSVLSFLAEAEPQVPAFAWLANVQLIDAPELKTVIILMSVMFLILGIVGLAGITRRRRVPALAGQPA